MSESKRPPRPTKPAAARAPGSKTPPPPAVVPTPPPPAPQRSAPPPPPVVEAPAIAAAPSDDERWMDLALVHARSGKPSPNPHVGAVIVKDGIIDPALVAKTALINAASVAGLMLTTDVLVTELKEEKEVESGAVA